MSDFVTECRREWKRLRVPDSVADEMAADLAADLSEAASEGVSAEEVLGAAVHDPRSFAASWAAERGVIEPRPAARRPRGGSLVLGAIAVLSVAALAAGVAILATPSATTSALQLSPDGRLAVFGAGAVWVATVRQADTGPTTHRVTWIDVGRRGVHSATITFSPPPDRFVGAPLPGQRSADADTIAWTLLIAGIVGIVLATLYWLRISRRTPSRHPDTDGSAAGYA
jgi:hypothetical protein